MYCDSFQLFNDLPFSSCNQSEFDHLFSSPPVAEQFNLLHSITLTSSVNAASSTERIKQCGEFSIIAYRSSNWRNV